MPDFGTPKANDATAQHEKTVQEVGEYAASLDQTVKDDVSNRPLGSVKVSPQQELDEWNVMKDDVNHLTQFLVDNKMTWEQGIQYLKKMNAK